MRFSPIQLMGPTCGQLKRSSGRSRKGGVLKCKTRSRAILPQMRRAVSLNLILFLLVGVSGLSFSVCRDFMARNPEIRMAASCADDGFCRKMCRLGQNDCPGLLQKTSSHSLGSVASLPADLTPPPLFPSEPSHPSLSNEPVDPSPPGEVYLLNTSFLI